MSESLQLREGNEGNEWMNKGRRELKKERRKNGNEEARKEGLKEEK